MDDETASHIHSVHFPMDKVGYTSETPRRKTSTASSGEKPRSRPARLPSFQVVDRQDGTDACAVSDTGSVETTADQVESDPAASCRESGLESSSAAAVGGFSMAQKRNEQVSEMAKIFPPCATKMFPPKPLSPSAFRFGCPR